MPTEQAIQTIACTDYRANHKDAKACINDIEPYPQDQRFVFPYKA